MLKKLSILLVVFSVLLFLPTSVFADTYYFSLDQLVANVYLEADGTISLDYVFVFTNDPSAAPIDFVDVGLPNSNFEVNSISADLDGQPIYNISQGDYQGSGVGVALALENQAIQPGDTGVVHIYITGIEKVIYPDSEDENYASAVFSPTWFSSQFIKGNTNISVTFHMPPGVQPDEPRWHAAPQGFPTEPETGIDEQGRVTYTWSNPQGQGSRQYKFGASFPVQYIPEDTVVRPNIIASLGSFIQALLPFSFCCGFTVFAGFLVVSAFRGTQKRKLKYLSPKIAIEGHGIKRGLTAVEAAILLEQPMDKILTMILFSTIKKGAASVTNREPLELEVSDPLPEGLQAYEEDFLHAMKETQSRARRDALQFAMVNLVEMVSKKMKGFSRGETVAYYKDIVNRAWLQVESAQTPEVKSEKYNDVMEWTMLDKDYEDRTREIFRTGPVFIPTWWGRYDPGYGRRISTTPGPASTTPSSPTGTGMTLPHLPGSDFAASVVGGVQNFSSSVIGNITDFTSGITEKTNPVPVTRSGRSGGGGFSGGCACACACAGCACACAGGGR